MILNFVLPPVQQGVCQIADVAVSGGFCAMARKGWQYELPMNSEIR
ncbi:hypothetical protein [Novosphingobium beihaiensis]|uniref:Uncharacterized protein n=1 Tax=Novosphingobium beihaiensis TaxID=2930389 RepID=A0ABT0BV29_9SPHN|nr:hypothetical protein [Novosphingobium beihaiensis]MCJ2188937.1 hypothetical protein [Novosphingobium beihaiensis]